ncbi:MFS transporter [Piscibacillus halophilus]|uniref:MFS transporter n=1 Tax=Piscibacillus halophilus TaxID=571933 RepID=UPI0034E9435C
MLIVSFLIQSVGCFLNPTFRTILPIITKEEKRTEVNSIYDTLTRGVTVLSPFLSVWLLNHYGVIHFFTIDMITYAISAYCISRVDIKERKEIVNKSIKKFLVQSQNFALWVRAHSTIKKLFYFTFITVFFNTWSWEVGLYLH